MMKTKSFLTLVMCFFCLTMSAAWDGTTVATAYAGGDGSKENPYQIATCEQFAFFAKCVNAGDNYSRGKYFKLTQDIVFNEGVVTAVNAASYATLTAGRMFPQTPVVGSFVSETSYVPFQGYFDGDGHSISGIYLTDYLSNNLSLFCATDKATVKNLTIRDGFVYGKSYLSMVASAIFDTKIINCQAVDCKIKGSSTNGGICGVTYNTCKIQNCYARVDFDVKNCCGGIAGKAANNTSGFENDVLIENCVTDCKMTYTKEGARAGIAYYLYAYAQLKDCWYATSDDATACLVAYGDTVWDEGKSSVGNCQAFRDVTVAVAAANDNARLISGACRFNADGTLDYSTFTAESEEEDDINAHVTDPSPADKDMHVEATSGTVTLSWTLSADGRTATQNVYLGTDKRAVALAQNPYAKLGKENSCVVTDLNVSKTYYWRVDRVTAEGKAVKGDVFSFRPAHLAFPGAEGYGRLAHGGRGGALVHVTSLADPLDADGKPVLTAGTLRWALTNGSGPRIVVFDVSGIIDMHWLTCRVDDYVTIAAQTAPGKGIMVFHSDIALGADNICRFLRARRGMGNINPATGLSDETGNAMGMNGDNSIMDHVSLSWGTDETFSSRNAKDITFQRSMIAEALGMAYHRKYDVDTNHGYAATIGGDIGTFSHNFLTDCEGRNWSMGGGTDATGAYAGRLDMFNNVCYNWGERATDGGAMEVNFIGNYYKVGPASLNSKLQKVLFLLQIEGDLKGQQQAYVSGNVRDEYDGTLVQDKEGDTYEAQVTSSRTTPVTWDLLVKTPFFGGEHHATVEKAEDAYKSVMSDNGANQPCLDEHDKRMFREAINRTYTYDGSRSGIHGQIDNEKDITAAGTTNGVEIYDQVSWDDLDAYDFDGNGLPDWWDSLIGTTDPNAYTSSTYTNVEDYTNFFAAPHVFLRSGASVSLNLADLFMGYTKSPVYSVEGVDNSLVSAAVSGSTLTVSGLANGKLTSLTMKVADAEGSAYQRTLNIALTTDMPVSTGTGISNVIMTEDDILSCEVYTVGGVKVGTSLHGLAAGIYVIKAVDKAGRQHDAKVIVR